MCESLLRQAPDGSLEARPGHGRRTRRRPRSCSRSGRREVLGRQAGDRRRRGVQPRPRTRTPSSAASTRPVFSRVKSITATGPTRSRSRSSSPTTGCTASSPRCPASSSRRASPSSRARSTAPRPGRSCAPARTSSSRWNAGRRRGRGRPTRTTGTRRSSPLVSQITFKGVPDDAALTSGLLTGAIQGTYAWRLTTLDQLKTSSTRQGLPGPGLVDRRVHRVEPQGRARRRAGAPGAVDGDRPPGHHRHGLQGRGADAAVAVEPGHVGLRQDRVRQAAYDSSPVLTQDIAEAKKLVQQAGATGKTITHRHLQPAAEHRRGDRRLPGGGAGDRAEGEAQVGVGRRTTSTSSSTPRPGRASTGSSPSTTATTPTRRRCCPRSSSRTARRTTTASTTRRSPQHWSRRAAPADPDQRAALVAKAREADHAAAALDPGRPADTVLVMSKALTGAPSSFAYMFAPWADSLGGTG